MELENSYNYLQILKLKTNHISTMCTTISRLYIIDYYNYTIIVTLYDSGMMRMTLL